MAATRALTRIQKILIVALVLIPLELALIYFFRSEVESPPAKNVDTREVRNASTPSPLSEPVLELPSASSSADGGKLDAGQMAALQEAVPTESFTYDPTGKRDPFVPFDLSQTAGEIDPNNPLTGYEYGQLRLTSVLAGFDEPVAVVENNAGRGFTVRKGTVIGKLGGKVIDIQKDRVIVLEEITELDGQKRTNTVELTLRPKGSEDNLAKGKQPKVSP